MNEYVQANLQAQWDILAQCMFQMAQEGAPGGSGHNTIAISQINRVLRAVDDAIAKLAAPQTTGLILRHLAQKIKVIARDFSLFHRRLDVAALLWSMALVNTEAACLLFRSCGDERLAIELGRQALQIFSEARQHQDAMLNIGLA